MAKGSYARDEKKETKWRDDDLIVVLNDGSADDEYIDSKRHKVKMSIRSGSWFSQSKMTLEEILKYTYWWRQDLDQAQRRHELGLATHTGVDWDSFCREVCEITLNGRK